MITNKPTRIRVAALTFALLGIAGCGGESPDKMIASARDYLAKSDPPAAVIQLKNALAKNPNMAEARFLLGRALLETGDAAAAEVELRKAIELRFSAEKVIPTLARAMLAQGQHKKILEELASSPTVSAEDLADLKTTVGFSYAMQGNLDGARTSFNEALVAKADYAPALLAQARLKAQEQDLPGAQLIVDGILSKSPSDVDAWHFKADLLRAIGNTSEAVAAYQKVTEIRPKALTAHAALIMHFLREQKPDLADKQFEAMQKAASKHPLSLYMQGLIAYSRKDLPSVRSAMDALLKVQPNNPQGLQLAGIAAFESRSDLQAQEYLAKALYLVPGLDFSRRALVLSQLRSGQPGKALATLQPVLKGDETALHWLALAGEAHMLSGNATTAEEFFKRAAKADPQNKRAQAALAMARMQTGHANQAFSDLEQIAAADSGITADLALIASSMREKKFDLALKGIANLEKKQPDYPTAHNLRGNALLSKGDIEGARNSFEKALVLNATYLPAVASLARMDFAAKQPDQARRRFESVLAKEPNNTQAMLMLAELRTQTGGSQEEISGLLAKAISSAPADASPRLALIGLHLRSKEHNKALAAAQEAMAAIPDRPEILDAAGQVFQLTGDTNQALATYSKLATLLPTAPHPYLRMAEVQLAVKNKEGARNSLNKGLTLLPDSLPMHRAQIALDIADGHFDTALSRARDIQKTQPNEIAGYLLEGDVHLAQKAWNQAAAAYRATMKIAPSSDLAARLHTILMLGGQATEATSLSESWLKAHPKDSEFRLLLADAANKRKDYNSAVAQYRTLLATTPENPVLLNNLAWSLGQLQDPKAITYAEQANKLAPNQPALMDTLGVLLVEQGNIEKGLDLLAKALNLAPQAADIRLSYAKALLKAGKKPAAKQELENLEKLGDKYPAHEEVSALLKAM